MSLYMCICDAVISAVVICRVSVVHLVVLVLEEPLDSLENLGLWDLKVTAVMMEDL